MIAMFVGALVGVFLVSRFYVWALKSLGDTATRIAFAYAAVCATVLLLAGFGFRDTAGQPRFAFILEMYGPAVLICLAIDLLAMRGRRVKSVA